MPTEVTIELNDELLSLIETRRQVTNVSERIKRDEDVFESVPVEEDFDADRTDTVGRDREGEGTTEDEANDPESEASDPESEVVYRTSYRLTDGDAHVTLSDEITRLLVVGLLTKQDDPETWQTADAVAELPVEERDDHEVFERLEHEQIETLYG